MDTSDKRTIPRLIGGVRGLPPMLADGLLAVALLTLGIAGLITPLLFDQPYRDADVFAIALIVGQTLPLTWRRRHPGTVLVVTLLSTAVYLVALYVPTNATLGALVAVYSFAAHSDRHRWSAAVFAVAVISFVNIGGMVYAERVELTAEQVLASYFVLAACWLLGDNMRRRREHAADLEARAARLERERDERARRAVEEERSRIARELHDVVAHNVSVMVIQAGAARRLVHEPSGRAAEALRAIEESGRQALVDMRRLLGVLRPGHDDGPREPQPTLAGIDSLVSAVRDAGVSVDVSIEGEPTVLPPGVELTAYRIVQEALTNVLKHAGAASARVAVRYRPHDVEVEVSDDGRGAAADLRGHGESGHGIVGMRERVSLFGGDLENGPMPGGGYRVRARIPVATMHAGDRSGAP